MDDSPGEKCEHVIVFECMDLCIGQRVNVDNSTCSSAIHSLDGIFFCVRWLFCTYLSEPRCEKTGLRGFRPGPTQTGLCSYTRSLEA